MNFSEKLKLKRKEFGMSQEQLAEKIGVSRQAITKWETEGGLPDIESFDAFMLPLKWKMEQQPSFTFEKKHATNRSIYRKSMCFPRIFAK